MEIEQYKKVFNYILDKITYENIGEVPDNISLEYYTFCQNLTKYLGINSYEELYNCREQVLEYLSNTFPYSFQKVDNKNIDDAIKLYVISLGETIDKVPLVISMLQQTKMTHINKKTIRDLLETKEMEIIDEPVQLDNILGTSVSKYQNDNLYDLLVNINDKNINSYISYLINNNIFNDEKQFQKVFSGISVTIDQNDNKYINEGNHRILTYLALIKIRDFLNISTQSKTFKTNATVYKKTVLNKSRGK
jgi:hypothetical protein